MAAVGPNVHLHVGHQNAWSSSVPQGAWTSTAVAFPSPGQRSGPGGNPPSDERDSMVEATPRC
jgi:hypothetical protein